MKNILITGGAGFIGSNLVHYMIKRYPVYNIIVYDKLTYAGNKKNLDDDGCSASPNFNFVQGDICDENKLMETFNLFKITDVIHLAAESHVDRSIVDPYIFERTNVYGTLCLLNVAKKYWLETFGTLDGHRFHHVSTDEVYGSLELNDDRKFKETDKYDPHSPYSASKASSDHFVKSFHDTYGMDVTISNCSNNYGEYQYPEKLIPLVIEKIHQEKMIPVYGKGLNVRDWLYVGDHCAAIDLIFHKGKSGETYNVGGNNEKTNIDLINTIIEVYSRLFVDKVSEAFTVFNGKTMPFEKEEMTYNGLVEKLKKLITFVEDRKGHDLRYAIDSTKLQDLGWKPEVSFNEGIERTIKFYDKKRNEEKREQLYFNEKNKFLLEIITK